MINKFIVVVSIEFPAKNKERSVHLVHTRRIDKIRESMGMIVLK
jgi:hypothetical protein